MRAAGIPLPGVELKVVDERGNEVPPHTVGAAVTRTLTNMVGYWGLPEATSGTFDANG